MSNFFPTGIEMCPDDKAGSTTCSPNAVGFGWLLIGIISMILIFSILCAVRYAIKRKYSDRHGMGVVTTTSSYENQATAQDEGRTIM
ncbi:unnamed protein product [Cylicocyclus nassatus]|uniref:Uncharacterized protein n=1 Tax=Cylicocyclus nassatus TaxID=53992 RepID=A0AA36GN15_CYLNA|nr:unnamed protein product [Cylicocyclus nassatus]